MIANILFLAVTWEKILEMGQKAINEKYPINGILWCRSTIKKYLIMFLKIFSIDPGGGMSKYELVHKIRALLFHWIPAILIDTLLFCLGFKPM